MRCMSLLCRSRNYLLLISLPLLAQSPGDWPTYNRDLASSRFSPLTQITPANVNKLALAWSYKLRPDADSPNSGTMNEVTPIVVNGVMYLPAGNRVVALDPDSYRFSARRGLLARR
jgi:glucose dehydrogenase